jgi:transcriptional regulator with XRE-family HTH domain
MDKDFKEKVEKRIKLMGVKKSFVAERLGISKSQLSQTFSGMRKLNPNEETILRNMLNL